MNFPKVSWVMSSAEELRVGLCHSPREYATVTHTQGNILYPSPLLVYSVAVCHSPDLIFAAMQRVTLDHEWNKETFFSSTSSVWKNPIILAAFHTNSCCCQGIASSHYSKVEPHAL